MNTSHFMCSSPPPFKTKHTFAIFVTPIKKVKRKVCVCILDFESNKSYESYSKLTHSIAWLSYHLCVYSFCSLFELNQLKNFIRMCSPHSKNNRSLIRLHCASRALLELTYSLLECHSSLKHGSMFKLEVSWVLWFTLYIKLGRVDWHICSCMRWMCGKANIWI